MTHKWRRGYSWRRGEEEETREEVEENKGKKRLEKLPDENLQLAV